MNKPKSLSKKDLKNLINKNGGFFVSDVETNAEMPENIKQLIQESKRYNKNQKAELIANGTYFKGVSSSGDLNRNGYIIRSKAWKPAIEKYLAENPVILLQHNMEQVIGQTLTAKVSGDKLITEGVIFADQMPQESALAFERGMLKALSTGHYTKEVEWENQETGQVLNDEQFRQLTWEERIQDIWVMAVTALEWIEQSLVGIGSNRESMITLKNAKMNYFQNAFGENISDEMKNDIDDIQDPTDEEIEQVEEEKIVLEPESPDNEEENRAMDDEIVADDTETEEVVEEEAEVEEPATEEEPTETEATDADEKVSEESQTEQVETPAESDAENADEEEKTVEEVEVENTETESVKDILQDGADTLKKNLACDTEEPEIPDEEEVKTESLSIPCDENLLKNLEANGLTEVKDLIVNLADKVKQREKQISEILTKLDKMPKVKGLSIMSQFTDQKNVTVNKYKTDGSATVDAFGRSGLDGILRQ